MIRIIHQRAKCIGCNYCVEAAPSRWFMDDIDGKSNLIGAKEKRGIFIVITTDDEFDENSEAAEICPVNIIKVEKF
ncbi:MAG: ferredoxin [Bacteroidetes bacterium]|nr:ferredoxin [Bacteroidales bacterium]RLD53375.1 MAG: ferredoxin [Bacteroidota bacterium]